MYFHENHYDHHDDDEVLWPSDWMNRARPTEPEPRLPHPSAETMEERWAFRKSIREQTMQHRRIQVHGGLGDTGRNIALVLQDRERSGARRCIMRRDDDDDSPPPPRSPSYPMTVFREVQTFAEYSSVVRYHSSYLKHLGGPDSNNNEGENDRPASSSAVSTISIAFSCDSQTMASTHGDHTVKITCCSTGSLLKSLEGHPRTPWTVKYHPIDNDIVASGCLGCQVRVWNWREGRCLRMIRLDYAIISLSFHPSGHVIAVASGSRLHFWDHANYGGRDDGNEGARGALTEVEQRHMLRCVHFPPNGTTLIVGGTNPVNDNARQRRLGGGMSGGGMSFYLRLWDFDLNAALHPDERDARDVRSALRLQRKALSFGRTFVPRALLYNDGGFDVSPDGMTLCACAEYWLPDGVDSAMELLNREEQLDDTASEGSDSNSESEDGSDGEERGNMEVTPQSSPHRRGFAGTLPVTPPNPGPEQLLPLTPPPPPGFRPVPPIHPGLGARPGHGSWPAAGIGGRQPRYRSTGGSQRQPQPHPLSIVSGSLDFPDVARQPGRYVPHVVTVSLDTSPVGNDEGSTFYQSRGNTTAVARGHSPRLGQLIEAAPLDGTKAAAVTCVKFSPSADFCLLGYGVREPAEGGQHHPVTALYRVRGGMTHVSTMLSGDDDVNIARFHPDSGNGFVYGTKQGRIRILSPRPWNYYNC